MPNANELDQIWGLICLDLGRFRPILADLGQFTPMLVLRHLAADSFGI
jgi:hypothetical protein